MPIMNRFLLRSYRKKLIALFAFLSAYTYVYLHATVIRTYKVPVNCEWNVHVFLLQQHLSLHKNLIKTLVSFNFPFFPWREGDGQMNRGTYERRQYPSFENYGFFYKQLTAFNLVFFVIWFFHLIKSHLLICFEGCHCILDYWIIAVSYAFEWNSIKVDELLGSKRFLYSRISRTFPK